MALQTRGSEVVAQAHAIVVAAVEAQVGCVYEGSLGQGVFRFKHAVGVFFAASQRPGITHQVSGQRKGVEAGLCAQGEAAPVAVVVVVDTLFPVKRFDG